MAKGRAKEKANYAKAVRDSDMAYELHHVHEVRTENPELDALRSFILRESPKVAAEAIFFEALGLTGMVNTAVDAAKLGKEFVQNFAAVQSDPKTKDLPFFDMMIEAGKKSGVSIVIDKATGKVVGATGLKDTPKAVASSVGSEVIRKTTK